MNIVYGLVGVIIGAAGMGIYNLLNVNQVTQFAAKIMAEFEKLKAKI